MSMYYAETRADSSGYTKHRVTCRVLMGSPFDNEQVCRVSFHRKNILNFYVLCRNKGR